MRDYVIITESTADLPADLVQELGIRVIPMAFEIEEQGYTHYPDEREMKSKIFYDMLRMGSKSVTSLVNTETFLEYFRAVLDEDKDVLYIGFSSGLSGTYNSSLIARDELLEQYTESKIICVDTKAASAGEGMLVYTAVKKKEEGQSIDKLSKWLEDNKLRLCHWFTVDDLNHLKKGGRISALSATIGTALNIKPVLHVDDEGHLIPMEKVRGRKKSINALFDHMKETGTNLLEQVVFISHGDAYEEALSLKEMIISELKVKDVIITNIGPVVGSHSGPGTIALFFFGTKR